MAKRFVAVLVTLCAALAALCLSGCAEEGGKPSYQLISEKQLRKPAALFGFHHVVGRFKRKVAFFNPANLTQNKTERVG